jgi:phosphomannomutase
MIKRGIFKANDIRGITEGSDPEWDAAGSYAIGAALVEVLGLNRDSGALVVGRDMRTSGPQMAAAFINGVLSRGVDVIDIGLSSTDQLWFASGRLDLPGAMFTASHNPSEYNGIKFCLAGAKPITQAALAEIAERAIAAEPLPAVVRGQRSERDLLPAYANYLHSLVDLTDIRRLRVVADAGNGMAGSTLPAVLGGNDLELIGLFLDLDGTFPNHPPNPLVPENLLDAQAAVREKSADLALVFDGDADRCFIIDERGEVVSPSAITAMIASHELAREPGATIVCNKITSRVVPEVVLDEGGKIVITRVGHTFVKAAMAEHNAIFGGEHSAHYYFRDNYRADSGIIATMLVLERMSQSGMPLSELRKPLERYADSGEINTHVADAHETIERVAAHYEDAKQDRLDGLTVDFGDWWFNLRPSNTEPLLRLNLEAATRDECDTHVAEVLALITDG